VDFLGDLVDILQRGGPWAVTAVAMVVSGYLYREMQSLQREHAREKQDLNDRIIAMTAKQVEVLTTVNENHKNNNHHDSDTGTCQESDPTSIGRLLLRLGRINSEQLSRALASQAQVEDALLGAMLKQLGFVNDMDVALAMKIQAEMRSGRRMEAELDVLQSKVDETEAGARELSQALVEARRRRRERGEESRVTFLTPRLAAAAGRM
jgi:hypothetical protein